VGLDVELISVAGEWWRHSPAGLAPTVRPDPPADNRWQRGSVVDALYLCSDQACVWAEWYRHLAEFGVPPRAALPRDLWRYELDPIEVVDLSSQERLGRVGLAPPAPGRRGWAAFQAVGEQLHAGDAAGLLAPSAARPESVVLCLFLPAAVAPSALHVRPPARRIEEPPAPPTGMRT
jgi:RES domain-containing protein